MNDGERPEATTVLQVIGPSDSGKTTLIERLLERLSGRLRVGTVKSIHHDVELDTPGKDTHRHRSAGADTVVGVTPSGTFQMQDRGKTDTETEIDRLEEILDRFVTDGYDVVLVEGFKSASYPSIVLAEEALVDDRTIAFGTDPDAIDLDAVVDLLGRQTA